MSNHWTLFKLSLARSRWSKWCCPSCWRFRQCQRWWIWCSTNKILRFIDLTWWIERNYWTWFGYSWETWWFRTQQSSRFEKNWKRWWPYCLRCYWHFVNIQHNNLLSLTFTKSSLFRYKFFLSFICIKTN